MATGKIRSLPGHPHAQHSKRMKRTFTRYHYLLAPVLVCGHCGGKMYGEAQGSGGTGPIRLYYGCSNRRKRLARIPNDKSNAWHPPE